MPTYEGICPGAGEAAWANCYVREGRDSFEEAVEAIERCRGFIVGGALDDILRGHRRDVLDLGR